MADIAVDATVAGVFVAARCAAQALGGYPGLPPADLDAAYAIQEEAVALWPDRVVGWKVGRIPDDQQARLGADRLVGPIFACGVRQAGAEPSAMPAFAGGFAAVEAEFVAVLGEQASDERVIDIAGAMSRIAAVHSGVEIASSPRSTISAHR